MNPEPELHDVEVRLRTLGASFRSELETRNVAPTVVDILRHDRARRAPSSRRRVRRVAAIVAIGLVATTSAAWAIKTVVFDGGAVTVHHGPAPTLPLVVRIGLGRQVGLEQARTLPNFLEPHVSWLDAAPTAWLDTNVPGQLSLTYPPGPGLPATPTSGLGMVIQTFDGDGHEVIRKYLETDTRATRVQIDGADAVFLDGGDHTLFYLRADGSYASTPGRLVGNALILRRGPLTVRVEAALALPRLVELANSLSAREGR